MLIFITLKMIYINLHTKLREVCCGKIFQEIVLHIIKAIYIFFNTKYDDFHKLKTIF